MNVSTKVPTNGMFISMTKQDRIDFDTVEEILDIVMSRHDKCQLVIRHYNLKDDEVVYLTK